MKSKVFVLFVLLSQFVFGVHSKDFYVKEDGSGIKDGSSWQDALDVKGFAETFRTSEAGSTFHIAEGLYKPFCDSLGVSGKDTINWCFFSNTPKNIIGGYSADPEEGEMPDAKLHKTRFSGDIKGDNNPEDEYENKSDDVSNVVLIVSKESGNCQFKGIEFSYCKAIRAASQSLLRVITKTTDVIVDTKVDSCSFMYAPNALSSNTGSCEVTGCDFYKNGVQFSSSYYNGSSEMKLNSCAIYNPKKFVSLNAAMACTVVNTTIEALSVYISGLSAEKMIFDNNTVLAENITVSASGDYVEVSGNILSGNSEFEKYIYKDKETELKVQYNVIKSLDEDNTYDVSKSSNIVSKDIEGLLKESDEERLCVKPLILLSDILPDGTSLRFPLDKADESTNGKDLYGNDRFDMTVIGANDFPCRSVETHLSGVEHISLDNTEDGILKNLEVSVGLLEKEVPDTLKRKCGGDSIVFHKIRIEPSLKRSDYFVKEKGSGTKDGSSWKDAMDLESFAYTFRMSNAGSTFHIAEGLYKPFCDSLGVSGKDTINWSFFSNTPKNIIGGYSANPEEGEIPNAKLHKTIFSGDILGNDTGVDYDYEHSRDDAINVVLIKSIVSGDCFFKNLEFNRCGAEKGCRQAMLAIVSYIDDVEVNAKVDSCMFKYGSVALGNNCGLMDVYACDFFENYDIFDYYENGRSGSLSFNSCSVYDSDRIQLVGASQCSISNSTFESKTFNTGNGSEANSKFVFSGNTVLCDEELRLMANGGISEYVGNIFSGQVIFQTYNYGEGPDPVVAVSHNVIKEIDESGNYEISTTSNIVNRDIAGLLKESTDERLCVKPVILLSDILPDGTPLRFPLGKAEVATKGKDIFGKDRFQQTVMGAYEMACRDVKTYLTDVETVTKGEKKYGKTFDKLGKYEVLEALSTTCGGDSIVYHQIMVENCKVEASIYDTIVIGQELKVVDGTILKYDNVGEYSYVAKIKSTVDCDSIITYNIVVKENCKVEVTVNDTIFVGDELKVVGDTILKYDNVGEYSYVAKIKSTVDCDSIITYNIVVKENCKVEVTVNDTIFVGDELKVVGDTILRYDAVGEYTHVANTKSTVVCDSVITYKIVVLEKDEENEEENDDEEVKENCKVEVTVNDTIFVGDELKVVGDTILRYDAVGEYTHVANTKSTVVCDSVITYKIVVLEKDEENEGENDDEEEKENCKVEETISDTIFVGDELKVIGGDVLTYDAVGEYIHVVNTTSTVACDSVVTYNIVVLSIDDLEIPTAFTPYKNDSKNDRFMSRHEVFIYNRNGMLICHSDDGWDATYDGKAVYPGVYVYVVKLYNGKLRRGTVEVLDVR